MHLDIRVTTAARQDIKHSPRMQRAVKLLQMSSLEYRSEIERLSADNPFLEEDDAVSQAQRERSHDALRGTGKAKSSASFDGDAWESHDADYRQLVRTAVRLLKISPRLTQIALAIVDCLDDSGYLRLSAEEVSALCAVAPDCTRDEFELALRYLQSAAPAGIGARSLAECLRLQVVEVFPIEDQALATRLIDQHLPAIAKGRLAPLASEVGVEISVLNRLLSGIRGMNPRPARALQNDPIQYLVPDVFLHRKRTGWQAILNDDSVPRVRLDSALATMFSRSRGRSDTALSEQLQDAKWIIKQIETRSQTILLVAQSIAERQLAYFNHGPIGLKPMRLSEVAADIGVHESTVSRATHGKYMDTPTGTIELRTLFSRTLPAAGPATPVSGKAVSSLIREILLAEPQSRSLSDAALARRLSDQGVHLARRTVTKYRQILGIPSFDRRNALSESLR